MTELNASVSLSITAALAKVGELEAAMKKATNVSVGSGGGLSKAADETKRLGDNAEASFRSFSHLTQVGSTMTKFVTLPILGVGAASIAMATQFDAAITVLETRAGVPAEKLAGIRQALLDLAPVVGSTPLELAKGLELIEGDGIHGAQALDVLTASAKATAIGLGDVKTVAAAVTTILNAYPAANITAAQATNVLVSAVKEGKVEASDMATQLGRVLEPAALVGVNVGEAAGAIAALSRVTGNVSQATTDFAGVLSFLIKPSVQAQDALQSVGLSSQQLLDTITNKGLLAALTLLKERFGDNTLALGQLFRNRTGLIGFEGLTQDIARTGAILDSTGRSFTSTSGDVDGFAAVTQTAGFKFKQAMALISEAGIAIGEPLAQHAADGARAVSKLAAGFADLPRPVQLGIESVAGLAAIGGPILVAIGQIGKMVTAIGALPDKMQGAVGVIAKGTGVAVLSLTGLTSAFEATQGGAVQAGVGIAGAAASIGIAFATTGPIGGAITTIATVGGAVLGMFENNAKKTAEFKAAASLLADELTKELTPALAALAQAGQLKAIDVSGLDRIRQDVLALPAQTQGALADLGANVGTVVEAMKGGQAGVDKFFNSLINSRLDKDDIDTLGKYGISVDQLDKSLLNFGVAFHDGSLSKEAAGVIQPIIAKLTGNGTGDPASLQGAYKAVSGEQAKVVQAVADINAKQRFSLEAAVAAGGEYNASLVEIGQTTGLVTTKIAGMGAAQADWVAEFQESKLPVGIDILDRLGLTVDDLAANYNDLEKSAKAAHDAILEALTIPIDKANDQLDQIQARKDLIKDLAAAKKAQTTKTVTTGTGKSRKTSKVVVGGNAGALNTNIEDPLLNLTDEQIAVRSDVIDRIAAAQKRYVDSVSSGQTTLAAADLIYQANIIDLEGLGKAAGLTKDQVDKFVGALGATPEIVKTIIQAIGLTDSLAKSEAYQKLLGDLPPDVATKLEATTKGDERVAILVGYLNDISADPTKTAQIVADVQGITDAQALKAAIDGTNSKTVTVTVKQKLINDAIAGGATPDQIGSTPANGGFVGRFAAGGVYAAAKARVPQIASTRGPVRGILWAEPETGWEAYISGKPSMRNRNIGILHETARRFGMQLYRPAQRMDTGGTINMPPITVQAGGGSLVPVVNELRALRAELAAVKGDVIVQIAEPPTKNPDVWGARVGHAVQAVGS